MAHNKAVITAVKTLQRYQQGDPADADVVSAIPSASGTPRHSLWFILLHRAS